VRPARRQRQVKRSNGATDVVVAVAAVTVVGGVATVVAATNRRYHLLGPNPPVVVHAELRQAPEVVRGAEQRKNVCDAIAATHTGASATWRRCIRWPIFRSTLGRVAR